MWTSTSPTPPKHTHTARRRSSTLASGGGRQSHTHPPTPTHPPTHTRTHPRTHTHTRASAMARKLKLPIPTSIITGHLGCGKTTAISSLIARKPADEHWCVIVNEFGALGVDDLTLNAAAAAATTSVTVKQIAGGCMCCAQAGMLLPALAQIVRTVKPDRLIIEPSGLGHPGGLLDVLQGPHLASALQLNAIVCLVDLSCFDPQQLAATSPTAMDQVNLADVLVGSKADAAPAEAVPAFQQWAQDELFPLKSQVLVAAQGQVPLSCLDAARSAGAVLMQQRSSSNSSSRGRQQQLLQQGQGQPPVLALPAEAEAGSASSSSPQPRRPLRVTSDQQQQQFVSCGWVFHDADRFTPGLLLELLNALQPAVARVKGVFRVADKQTWVAPAAAGACTMGAAATAGQSPVAGGSRVDAAAQQQLVLQPVCHRGASIVEVICDTSREPAWQRQLLEVLWAHSGAGASAAADDVWAGLEQALLACLQ